MKKHIILFIIFVSSFVHSQVFLSSYNENRNQIILRVKLSPVDLLSEDNKTGFWDESKPGYPALPGKSIIVGLPFSDKYQYSTKIIKQEIEKKKLKFNPEVKQTLKDKLEYNFKPTIIRKENNQEAITIKGYLWIDGIYCVHLEINQYKFDEKKNTIKRIDELEIKINFDKNSNIKKKNIQFLNNKNYDYIINAEYASSYEVPTELYQKINNADDWINYNSTYLKIGVASDGIYRLSYSDLSSNGVPVTSISPKNFRLFMKGKEIPIFVYGEDDQSFDLGDYIEFVGIRNMGGKHRELSGYDEPYNEYLGRYTDTTIYWLTWDGVDGKRVEISNGNITGDTDTLHYYHEIIHSEKNGWYDFAIASLVRREMPYWTENKTWSEGNLNIGTKNKSFIVSNVYPNTDFQIYTKLQDYVSNISTNAHLISLGLNSSAQTYDSTWVDKYQKVILSMNLNSDELIDGTNTLNIHSYPTEASINVCVFDWFEVEYPRFIIPFSDSLKFSFPYLNGKTERTFKIMQVNSDNYTMWKYGDKYKKYNLEKINNEITLDDSISTNDKFWFIDDSKIQTPKIYYIKQFKNLRSPKLKADYIAITHKKFKVKVDDYSNFISESYGLTTKVIDIDDIYDEFSYGFFNPEAIQDFLKSTHIYWQDPKPQYVVLIGGATYDYYGNKYKYTSVNYRVLNYVPSFGASVSDNWFVTWDTTGAYIPQMNIGRIPVTTNEEFEWYFEKHRNYLTQEYDAWNKHYLFFSGGDDHNESELDLLRETNQFVIDNYTSSAPIGGNTDHFYKTIDPKTNFGPYSPEYIQNSIDNGGVFISYLGHSGTQTWDNSITHPSQLKNNKDRYPIVSDFGCSTGRFAEPDVISFSQLFTLDPVGQCLGYIGNSSLGFISTSISMPKFFYKKILVENIYNVSEAHKEAKLEMLETYGSTGVYALFALTNTLIGDPLITLPIPQKPNFVTKEEDIHIDTDLITDLQDSVEVNFTIFNYGTVLPDSLEILILHSYQTQLDSIPLKIRIPNFKDSLSVKLAVKDMSGNHQITISLDPQNNFDELSKEDNVSSMSFYVASSSIRPIIQYQVESGFIGSIDFLNPTSYTNSKSIVVEYSLNKDFSGANNFEVQLDTLSTLVNFNQLQKDRRYWGRAKLSGLDNYSSIFSFNNLRSNKFSLTDSISFEQNFLTDLHIKNNKMLIDSTHINFELFSAGFSDGNTALIMKNKENYIPENTLRGHHICLFEDSTYEFVESKVFDLLGGGSATAAEYAAFLDTISTKYLVMFAIKDEGAVNLSNTLRDKIKLFGSALIDDVAFRGSWAFIGKRGAVIGTMPEAVSTEGNGPVTIDTTISFLSDKGTMLTTEIGPTSKWEKLVVNQETPSNSSITYTPIGIRDDGVLDTLQSLALQDSVADLSFISSDLYPKIKLLTEFQASDDKQSPILNSLGVDYTDVAELGLNYQVVSVEHDSVTQGEKNKLSFYIYNVGESRADSFTVKVELLKPDNSAQLIDKFTTSIDSMNRKYFEYDYTLLKEYGWGDMQFAVTADSEDKITEFFEDNNYYQIPFYVKKDTLTDIVSAEATITIDGYDIIDGDFVSNQPEIIFQIDYEGPFPVYDTTAVNYYLDNKRIPYVDMQVDYDTINQTVKSTYTPPLEDGDHFLKVSGTSFGLDKYFTVSNELKIVDLYNYPNPFSENTAFTFKLTRVPEEVVIKIYTVAGRLIKNISLTSSDLKTDFNKIEWDGRDEDGDQIANGVYIYKVILKDSDESESYVQKLAVMR